MKKSELWEKKVAEWSEKREGVLENLETDEEETAITVGEIIAKYVLKCYCCFVQIRTNDGLIRIRIAGKEVTIAGTVYGQREAEATQHFLQEIGFLCDEFETHYVDKEEWWISCVKLVEKIQSREL